MTPLPFNYTKSRPTAEQAVSENAAAVLLNLDLIATSLLPGEQQVNISDLFGPESPLDEPES